MYLFGLSSYFPHLYCNTKTYNSITLTATATKGTNEISKYYFSKDNGATWTAGHDVLVWVIQLLPPSLLYMYFAIFPSPAVPEVVI